MEFIIFLTIETEMAKKTCGVFRHLNATQFFVPTGSGQTLVTWLQGDGRLIQIAASTPTRSVLHQQKPTGGNAGNPASGPNSTVVLRTI